MNISLLLKRHLAVFFSLLGALSLFASSLFMKVITDEDSYYQYTQVVFFSSTALTWGALGFENYFISRCQVCLGNIEAKKIDYILLFTVPVVGSLLTTVIFFQFFFISNVDFFAYFILALLLVFSMVFFNFFKLLGHNLLGQIYLSAWKFSLLFVSILSFYYVAEAVYSLCLILALFLILLIPLLKKNLFGFLKLQDRNSYSLSYQLWIAIFFSISVVTLISQIDRVIVSTYLSPNDFSEYFFWGAIYLSPMTVFSSYFGTRVFTLYKQKKKTKKDLDSDLLKVMFLTFISIFISTIIGLSLVILYPYKVYWPNTFLLSAIVTVGALRSVYIYLSSLINIYINPKWSYTSGLSVLFLVLVFFFIFEFIASTYHILFCSLIFLWTLRVAQYYFFIRKRVSLSHA